MDSIVPFQGNAFIISAGFRTVPANRTSRGRLPQVLGYPDNLFRPNPQFLNGPHLTTNAAYLNYHGMQAIFRWRFHNGLQGQCNYTLSKNIDITATNDPAGVLDVLDFFQRNVSKGISANEITNDAEYNLIDEFLFGPGKWQGGNTAGWFADLLGGRQTSAIGGFTSRIWERPCARVVESSRQDKAASRRWQLRPASPRRYRVRSG
jgi:hypothetical protein